MSSENRRQGLPASQAQEIVNILMDSEMYLELPLKERNELLRHLAQTFSIHAATGPNTTSAQIVE
jgi:hypothetical protein